VKNPSTLPSHVLDELALAAMQARQEGVDKSQVNKLLEYLEATDSFTLMLFLARQIARGQWSRRGYYSAVRLFKIIKSLSDANADEARRKEVLRRALGYFKWFYESWDLNRGVGNELQRRLGQALIQALRNPRQPAPQGFAEEYLRALLRL